MAVDRATVDAAAADLEVRFGMAEGSVSVDYRDGTVSVRADTLAYLLDIAAAHDSGTYDSPGYA